MGKTPVWTGAPTSLVIVPGERIQFGGYASDPQNDPLRFSLVGTVPAGYSINRYTGEVSTSLGIVNGSFSIRASDREFYSDHSCSFSVAIGNRDPIWTGAPTSVTRSPGQSILFGPYASDPDGDVLTFSLTGNPPNYIINSVTAEVTILPGAITRPLTVRGTDPSGAFAEHICNVTVTAQGILDAGTSVETAAVGLLTGNYTGEYGGTWRESTTPLSRPTVVSTPTAFGSRAFKMELPASTYTPGIDNGKWRSGIEFISSSGMKVDGGTDINNRTWEGMEVWGGVAVMLAADYPHPNDASWPAAGIGYPNVGFDLHTAQAGQTWSGAAIALRASNVDNPGMWVVGSEQGAGDTTIGSYANDRGVWVAWVYNLVYSSKGLGRIKVWKNGVEVVTKTGVTTLKDGNQNTPYLKSQTYNGWINSGAVAKTLPKLTVYTDEIRWALGSLRYNDVNPNIEYPGVAISTFEGLVVGNTTFTEDPTHWSALSYAPYSQQKIVSSPVRSGVRATKAYVPYCADGGITCSTDATRYVSDRDEMRWQAPSKLPCPGIVTKPLSATDSTPINCKYATADFWYGFSVFVPSNLRVTYPSEVVGNVPNNVPRLTIPDWHIIHQMHGSIDAPGDLSNPRGSIRIVSSGDVYNLWQLRIAYPTQHTYALDPGLLYTVNVPAVLGEWTDFVICTRYHPQTGYQRVWKKDSLTGGAFSLVLSKTNGAGVWDAIEPYLKIGIYQSFWDRSKFTLAPSTADTFQRGWPVHSDGTRASNITIHYDEFRCYAGTLASDALGIDYVRPR